MKLSTGIAGALMLWALVSVSEAAERCFAVHISVTASDMEGNLYTGDEFMAEATSVEGEPFDEAVAGAQDGVASIFVDCVKPGDRVGVKAVAWYWDEESKQWGYASPDIRIVEGVSAYDVHIRMRYPEPDPVPARQATDPQKP